MLIALAKSAWEVLHTERGKRYSLIAASALSLFILAGLILPYFYSSRYLEKELSMHTVQAFGRHLAVRGQLRVRVFPLPGLEASHFLLFDPGNPDATPMVSAKHARLDFSLSKLLKGDLAISRVTLDSPVISVHIDKEGHTNWKPARHIIKEVKGNAYNIPILKLLQLGKEITLSRPAGKLVLTKASIYYSNAATGERVDVDDLNGYLIINPKAHMLQLRGTGLLNQIPSSWNLDVHNTHAFYTKERSKIKGSYATGTHSIAIDGMLERGTYSGNLDLEVMGLRHIIPHAYYYPFSNISSPLQLSFSSHYFKWSVLGYKFKDGKFELDKLRGHLDGTLLFKRTRPHLELDLALNHNNPTILVRKIINNDIPLPAFYSGHSEDEIDFKLPQMDIKLHVDLSKLQLFKTNINRADLTLTLKDRKLDFYVADAELLGGKSDIHLIMDASRKPTAWKAILDIKSMDLRPLLDNLERDFVGGSFNIKTSLMAKGSSKDEVLKNLSGNGSIYIKDGWLRHISAAAMFRNMPNAFNRALMRMSNTEFTSLRASYSINKGMLRSEDISLLSRLLDFSGRGTINLPEQTVSLRLIPERVIKLDGIITGRKVNFPLIIKGPLSHPEIKPDLKHPMSNHFKD